ncbi:MAG: hypothetical protein COV36_00915 [Alphaproteobacteria bacterium CG11_big_fil_rev_8_21_14_0_20_44_7]|nr:MAG: hypothetical protein COV36_00915 [Alphaproteobacteria bacterium CG11_big_fil_rev_8_21_14_0_20_44_7]
MNNPHKPKWKAGFFGFCPKCEKAKIFKGIISIKDNCNHCGEDFSKYETADGPAFFAIIIIGTLAGIFAAITEIMHEPPFWVHLLLWAPFSIIGSIIIIRISKGLMIAHQMRLT